MPICIRCKNVVIPIGKLHCLDCYHYLNAKQNAEKIESMQVWAEVCAEHRKIAVAYQTLILARRTHCAVNGCAGVPYYDALMKVVQ